MQAPLLDVAAADDAEAGRALRQPDATVTPSSRRPRPGGAGAAPPACFAPACACGVSKGGCFVAAAVAALGLAVLVILLATVVGPGIANASIDHSTLSLIRCSMHDPDATSVGLDCHVRLDNAGGVSATLRELRVDVLHSFAAGQAARRFGRMVMPRTDVLANEPTFIRLRTRLNVTDNEAFTEATAGVLQGNVGRWLVRGNATLDAHVAGVTLPFQVHLEKQMLLPPTVLSNVQAFDFAVVGSDAESVYATASCSLLSVSVLELQSLGELSFHLKDPENGGYIGEITMPDFAVSRGYNRFDNVTARVRVDPVAKPGSRAHNASRAAITRFFTLYARGEDIRTVLRGPSFIRSGSPFLLDLVTQNVTIANPGAFVSDMSTSDIEIVAGTKAVLSATARGQFTSASRVVAGALGAITFELTDPRGVAVGRVTMPSNFGVAPGKNVVQANVSMVKDGSPANAEAIATFVDTYAMGMPQNMVLRGPVDHPTSMLDGFLVQPIVANGIANPNLVVGSILTHDAVGGFTAGDPHRYDGKVRGAVAVAGNPFSAQIRMSDVLYDIYLHDPIEYQVKSLIWTGDKTIHCPRTDKLARSQFLKGMHMYPMLCPDQKCDASKADQDWVDFEPSAQMSFLSPAFPMPGQEITDKDGHPIKCSSPVKFAFPDFGCCYATLFFGTACRAQRRGDAHFLARTNGSMTLQVGGFTTRSSIDQDVLSFTYEHDVIDGWLEAGELSCKDFTYPGEAGWNASLPLFGQR